jgi:hypothetical protein
MGGGGQVGRDAGNHPNNMTKDVCTAVSPGVFEHGCTWTRGARYMGAGVLKGI